jgi:hypothetical protein
LGRVKIIRKAEPFTFMCFVLSVVLILGEFLHNFLNAKAPDNKCYVKYVHFAKPIDFSIISLIFATLIFVYFAFFAFSIYF